MYPIDSKERCYKRSEGFPTFRSCCRCWGSRLAFPASGRRKDIPGTVCTVLQKGKVAIVRESQSVLKWRNTLRLFKCPKFLPVSGTIGAGEVYNRKWNGLECARVWLVCSSIGRTKITNRLLKKRIMLFDECPSSREVLKTSIIFPRFVFEWLGAWCNELQGRTPLTLHPRLCISPENFSAMVIPFWMFMARSLFFESGDVSTITLYIPCNY